MRIFAVMAIVCAAGTARADDNEWHQGTLEVSGTIQTRTAEVGALRIGGPSLGAAIGWRADRNTVELEYAFSLFRDGEGKAFGHDLAVRYRRSLVVIGGYYDGPRRGDGWIEAGLGGEALEMRGHDALWRPFATLGFGADVDFGKFADDYDMTRHRYVGGRLAARLLIGDAPDDKAVHDAVDVGIMLSAALVFGRS